MKIAILSDIHANAAALRSVLASVRKQKADALLIAGDLVGYYFESQSVLQLIQSFAKPVYIVRGNHEEMLLRAYQCTKELKKLTLKYGPGIQTTLEQLSNSDILLLTRLPHPLRINDFPCSILLCHGSPTAIDQYVYPDGCVQEVVQSLHQIPDVLIMGHTHYPFVKQVDSCLVINPGSVGQPRNRFPGAHWALLDTTTMNVEAFIEPYDASDLIEECFNSAPDFPYLSEVLIRS